MVPNAMLLKSQLLISAIVLTGLNRVGGEFGDKHREGATTCS